MQKSLTRLFMAVLMAALLVSASIMSVSAAEACTHTSEQVIAADTATLEAGTYILNEGVPADGKITVTGEVTLCLNDQTLTAPSGVTGSFITVNNGATLTICGGETGEGVISGTGTTDLRGIEVVSGGTLILESGTISGFTTTDDGGGVYIAEGGSFTMNSGKLSNNTAVNGGAIRNYGGTLTIVNGFIVKNTATTDGGGIRANKGGSTNPKTTITGGVFAGNKAGGNGGALSMSSSGPTITGGTFGGTPVTSADDLSETSGNYAKNGGGLYIGAASGLDPKGNTVTVCGNYASANGGGISIASTPTLGSGLIVENNTAAENGGGVYTLYKLTIEDGVQIQNNTAKNGGGLAFYYSSTSTSKVVYINGGTISGNNATACGGGVYIYNNKGTTVTGVGVEMSGGVIKSNTVASSSSSTKASGGGVYIGANSTFTMANGTIGGDAEADANAAFYGGGVYVAGTFIMEDGKVSYNKTTGTSNRGAGVYVDGATFTMTNGTISNNTATGGNGGGVYVVSSGNFTMENGTITENVTTLAGSAADTANGGGGVYVNGASFTMKNGTISNNEATKGNGGGILVQSKGTVTIEYGTITGNKAAAEKMSGGIFAKASGTTVAISGGAFSENMVGDSADVSIAVASSASVTITGGKFSQTIATGSEWLGEGAVVVDASAPYTCQILMNPVDACDKCGKSLAITETTTALNDAPYTLTDGVPAAGKITVTGNVTLCLCGNTLTAPASATGSFITVNEGATLTICGGGNGVITAAENTTNLRGIYVNAGGKLILNSGTISSFVSTGTGGGVYVNATSADKCGSFEMNGGAISGNSATQGAGIMVNGSGSSYGGSVTMTNGAIENNTTTGTSNGGGAVCLYGSAEFTMTNGTITGNSATKNKWGGDGLYGGVNTTINVSGGTISYNSAEEKTYGDGVASQGNVTLSGNVEIYDNVYTVSKNGKQVEIKGGTIHGTVGRGTVEGESVDGTFAISGGTFSKDTNTQDSLEALNALPCKVTEGDTAYTVAVNVVSDGAIVDYGSTLNLQLALRGDNGVYLADAKDYFDITLAEGSKYTVGTIKPGEGLSNYVTIEGIAAKEMHDDIALTIASKDGEYTETFTFSVYNAIKADYDEETDKESDRANMLEDVVNYGIAAQTEFNYTVSTETLGDGSAKPTWEATEGIGWTGNVNVAVSLNLKDRIELNVYVQSPDADATATLDNSEIDIRVSTSENESVDATTVTRFTIDTIDVVNAKKELVIAITDSAANPIGTLTYSIVDYVLANTSQPELMDALAKYMESVATVIGGNQ